MRVSKGSILAGFSGRPGKGWDWGRGWGSSTAPASASISAAAHSPVPGYTSMATGNSDLGRKILREFKDCYFPDEVRWKELIWENAAKEVVGNCARPDRRETIGPRAGGDGAAVRRPRPTPTACPRPVFGKVQVERYGAEFRRTIAAVFRRPVDQEKLVPLLRRNRRGAAGAGWRSNQSPANSSPKLIPCLTGRIQGKISLLKGFRSLSLFRTRQKSLVFFGSIPYTM